MKSDMTSNTEKIIDKALIEETNNSNNMKKELAQAKKQTRTSISMEVQIMERTDLGYSILNKERKFGLVKENRPIKPSVVNGFLQIIQNGKYDDTQSIVTIEATELYGKYNITDFEGNALTEDDVKDYLIVLDGQHRISAFSQLNAIRERENRVLIPNVHIKTELEDVRAYLADINMIGKSWSSTDKVCVAAVGTENKILVKINDLIKEGYSVSTASLICLGKRLSSKELNALLKEGNTSGLPNEEQAIERAEKFLTTAMSIDGMEVKTLRKRFYINGFNSFSASHNDVSAFKALESLAIKDFRGVKEDIDFVKCLKNTFDKLEQSA